MTKQIEYREDCFETIREGIKGKKAIKGNHSMIALKLIPMYILKLSENGIKKLKKKKILKNGRMQILWICKIGNKRKSLLKSDYTKMQKQTMKSIMTYKRT